MTIPHRTHGAAAIRQAFDRAHSEGRAALITFLTLGYPSMDASRPLVKAMQDGGADIIELGVPFSDPVADGPTIQRSSHAAIQAGTTPAGCMQLAHDLRRDGITVPLLFMGYYNPIFHHGLEDYASQCAAAGVDGFIVPDLPLEEAGELLAACRGQGLALVQLVAPTSGEERVARIAVATEGFLYVVSKLGTTGGEDGPGLELEEQLALVRRHATTPVAVGFGISSPDHVRALAPHVDGVVVGSSVVKLAPEGPAAVQRFVASLRSALASKTC